MTDAFSESPAGLGAGMLEAIIAVTPSEAIKWAHHRHDRTTDPYLISNIATEQSSSMTRVRQILVSRTCSKERV